MLNFKYRNSVLLITIPFVCFSQVAKASEVSKPPNQNLPITNESHPDSQQEINKKILLETKQCPGCDLSGLDLSGLDLSYSLLTRANLQKAKLIGTDLRGAVLFQANLCRATLISADLRTAILSFANLTGADMTYAKLSSVEYPDLGTDKDQNIRHYSRAYLNGAILEGAILSDSDLSGSDLANANIKNTDLRRADLSKTDLRDAQLNNANLSGVFGADLASQDNTYLLGKIGAILEEAQLKGAVFKDADLRGANLYNSTDGNLKDALTSRAILKTGEIDTSVNQTRNSGLFSPQCPLTPQ